MSQFHLLLTNLSGEMNLIHSNSLHQVEIFGQFGTWDVYTLPIHYHPVLLSLPNIRRRGSNGSAT